MGLDRTAFSRTLETLLFGRELPLSMIHAQSLTAASEEMSDSEMMRVSIGQGKTQITPIHLNMITCAIANGGVLMRTFVV
ncbi:penicillin-binding protein 2, partial [Klebsiella oxytoca]